MMTAPPRERGSSGLRATASATPATAATVAITSVLLAPERPYPAERDAPVAEALPPRLRLAGVEEDDEDWHICRGID